MRRTGLLLTIIMLSLVVPFLISTESSVPLVADEGPDSDGKELTPRSSFAPASWSDYFYVSTIYDNIWGTINNFAELQDGDSGYSDFYEEATGVYWAFQQVFKFDCDAYLYGDIELQIRGYDYNFGLGWAGEDLKVSWKDNLGDSYTYLGVISGTTSTSYSWTIAPEDNILFILIEGAIETSADWGSQNNWRLEYMRVYCHDYKVQNVGVSIDVLYDGDNIYAGRGVSSTRYVKFSCMADDEDDGGSTIDYMKLTAKDGAATLWWVDWDKISGWGCNGGIPAIINIVTSKSTSTLGPWRRREVTFAVELFMNHPEITDVSFELYTTSSTSDTDVYQKSWDIHTQLAYVTGPALESTRCDLGAEVSMTGRIKYSVSGEGVTPSPSAICGEWRRTAPTSTSWAFVYPLVDNSGYFSIQVQTTGSAGAVNIFEIKVLDGMWGGIQLGPDPASVTVDEVVAHDYGTVDSWISVGESTTIYTELEYASDSHQIDSGSLS